MASVFNYFIFIFTLHAQGSDIKKNPMTVNRNGETVLLWSSFLLHNTNNWSCLICDWAVSV
jgi:hypothetical protein